MNSYHYTGRGFQFYRMKMVLRMNYGDGRTIWMCLIPLTYLKMIETVNCCVFAVLFSHEAMSHSLQPHQQQHNRFPCLSLSTWVCSKSCTSSQRCYRYPNILSSIAPFSSCPQIFPSIRVFSNESVLRNRWLKYQSFSISPSSKHSGLISFRIDWFDLPAVHGTLKNVL